MTDDRPHHTSPTQQTPPQYSEEDLDRLQAKWVIGKQRGQENPLSKTELLYLVTSGRLKGEVLNKKEQDSIGFVGVISNIKKYPQSDIEVKKAHIKEAVLITRSLLDKIEEDFSGVVKQLFKDGVSDQEMMDVREILFRMKYGYFPDFFAFHLAHRLADSHE